MRMSPPSTHRRSELSLAPIASASSFGVSNDFAVAMRLKPGGFNRYWFFNHPQFITRNAQLKELTDFRLTPPDPLPTLCDRFGRFGRTDRISGRRHGAPVE